MKRMGTRVDKARNDKARDEYIFDLVNQVLGKSKTRHADLNKGSSMSISEDTVTKNYGSQ